jgi:glycosyltransferase involved in cell wall biosynthesis
LTSLKWNCPPIWQDKFLQISQSVRLRQHIDESDIVLVEHPWQFRWVHQAVKGRMPLVLSTPNVEADLYDDPTKINAPKALARYVVREVAKQESYAVHAAQVMLATCEQDKQGLIQRYGLHEGTINIIPNGVDCDLLMPADSFTKAAARAKLGLPNVHLVVFAGSMHRPNVEAVEQIVHWATEWPDDQTTFLIVGTVGRLFQSIKHPRLIFTGSVSDTKPYFDASDIAINPMLSGSGTNLKQLEFMSAGLPTIATAVGARGIPLRNGQDGIMCNLADFPKNIQSLRENPSRRQSLGLAGRALVKAHFDWQLIGDRLIRLIESQLVGQASNRV